MLNKKYYTIAEVTTICKIHSHQLRYIEKRFPNFITLRIKGRRYYTKEDIEFIKLNLRSIKTQPHDLTLYTDELATSPALLCNEDFPNKIPTLSSEQSSKEMIEKIDHLIHKFCQIKMQLCLTNSP